MKPMIDFQAIDRVHRLGQKRTVYVKRFLISGSIDEKIFRLQQEKMKTAKQTLEREGDGDRPNRSRDMIRLLER
jgi:SNF2 family DNA or RNA helicase